jgi:predicted small secreted protein
MKLALALALILSMVGCGTVAGIGKDLTSTADWTKEKMK